MLLEELIKYTWKEHRDYAKLVQVHDQMKDVAATINESKAKFEQRAKVTQLSRLLKTPPVHTVFKIEMDSPQTLQNDSSDIILPGQSGFHTSR